jgi:hypothetical protein
MKIARPLQRLPMMAPELPQPSGISQAEIQLIIDSRLNTLLCGALPSVSAALSALRPLIRRPLVVASGSAWRAPSASTATLVVENVAALSSEEQRAMIDWLESTSRQVQVISTSERPLFELVERGTFSDRLSYRLNVMHLEL